MPILTPETLNATMVLAQRSSTHPQLRRAEAQARVELAAAILVWDAAELAKSEDLSVHTLNEQQAVNTALQKYGEALANYLRGES